VTDTPALSPLPADVRLMNALATALFVLAGVALLAAAAGWLVRLPVFAIQSVRLEGDLTRNSVSTVRANAMPRLQGNFFTLDLQRAREAFESVPWVRQAVVRREWPGRLRVRLIEHHAAAIWQDRAGTERLVDTEGTLFDANLGDVEDEQLPVFSGPDESAPRMLGLYRQLGPVFDRLDTEVVRVAMSARGSLKVELDSGADVELGRGEDAELLARVDRFTRTLTQVTSHYQRPLVYADLRHVDGYAVRLQGISTTLPAAAGGKARKN
jgi:cell division protein FtsQ